MDSASWDWTATSAVSLLAVTEKRVVSSGVQPSDPSLRFYGLPLKGLDCHVGMEPPRSDVINHVRHRERSVAIHYL